jgi:hypothetical protein
MIKLLEYIVNIAVDRIILWPFYYPIVFLMKEVKVGKARKNNGITLLAINSSRFRGDLEVLAQSGFKVYMMPYTWQTRVFYAYKDRKLKEQFKNPIKNSSIHMDRARVRRYLYYLLEKVFLKKNISCVIGAGLFYHQDIDWGAATVKAGRPYIVFHRENLVVNKDTYAYTVKRAKLLRKMGFVGTSIVFQNKVMKDIFDKHSGVSVNKIYALGATRMDQYIRDIKSKRKTLINGRITLFTFPVSSFFSLKRNDNFGWHELHRGVHTSFVEIAKQNPEIEFVIKHKGVKWKETKALLSSLNALNIDNLKIYGELSYDTHKLILESDVVTGFCSTALLESAIAGKPIIYPLFAEANDKRYKDFICFSDALGMFDIANSIGEYKELIIKRVSNFKVSKTVMSLRERQFEKYVSSLKSDSAKKYSELIINEVKTRNKIDNIKGRDSA